MKITSLYRKSTALVLGVALTMSACKKDNDTNVNDEEATIALEQSGDETMSSHEFEDLTADVEQLITTGPLAGGRIGRDMCGVTLDSSISNRTYTITFDSGMACSGRTRSGTVVVTLYNATRWREQNAVLGIQFNNVKVKRIADNRAVEIDGLTKIYNVSGGLVSQLYADPSTQIVRRIRTAALRSKNNGTTFQSWNEAKTRTWTLVGNEILRLTVTGDTSLTLNDLANVSAWGQSRRNQDYVTRITVPIVRNSNCSNNAASGNKVHTVKNKQVNVLFGVNDQGQPQTTGCPYGALVTWTNKGGNSQTRVVAY